MKDTITVAGVTAERTWSANPTTDPFAHLLDQRCVACGTQVTDDDHGPFYDSVADDGTPHVCPIMRPGQVLDMQADLLDRLER